MAKHYFGEYNQNGYSIYISDSPYDGVIYQAGNCKYDSAQYLPVGAEGTIDITTIEDYCNQTGQEIAEENGGIWDGAKQVDDYDEFC